MKPAVEPREHNWCFVVASHLWAKPFEVIRHSPPRVAPWRSTPCGQSTSLDATSRMVGISNAIAVLFTQPCSRCWPARTEP